MLVNHVFDCGAQFVGIKRNSPQRETVISYVLTCLQFMRKIPHMANRMSEPHYVELLGEINAAQ